MADGTEVTRHIGSNGDVPVADHREADGVSRHGYNLRPRRLILNTPHLQDEGDPMGPGHIRRWQRPVELPHMGSDGTSGREAQIRKR